MKRFILFFSVLLFSFQSSNAQTISTVLDSINCAGDEATLNVTATGTVPSDAEWALVISTGPNTWSFIGGLPIPATSNTNIYTNLSNGQYAVMLVNSSYNIFVDDTTNNVYAVAYIFIPPAPPFIAAALALDSNECFGDCNASVQVQVFGGYAPIYHDAGSGGAFNNLLSTSFDTVINICGNPNLVITFEDNNGCTTTTSPIEVYEPTPILVDTILVDSITCYDANDGQIQLNVTGGNQPYEFDWTNLSTNVPNVTTNPTGNVLSPGSWICEITDANGCVEFSDTVHLNNPPEFLVNVTDSANPTCNGYSDGMLEITVDPNALGSNNIFEPYNFIINGNANPNSFSPYNTGNILSVGQQLIEARDINNCPAYDTVTLIEPDPITFDTEFDSILCNGDCNGQIRLTNFQGGNLPQFGSSSVFYTDPQGFLFTIPFDSIIIDSNLCAGTYSYFVEDDLGCLSNTEQITLVDPPLFTIIASNPFEYNNGTPQNPNGFNVSCPGAQDASFTLEAFNAALSFSGLVDYYVNGPLYSTTAVSPIIINNIYGDLTNGGPTEIIAVDANGCQATTNISLSEPLPYLVTLTAIDENCSQNNGKVYANIIGGTSPYLYNWSGPNGFSQSAGPMPNTTDSITNLAGGTYGITITDSLNCTAINSIFVGETNILITAQTFNKCNDSTGSIILSSNGVLLNTLLWSNSTPLGGSAGDTLKWVDPLTSTFDTLTGLSAGTYWYQVQRNGCAPYTGSVEVGPDLVVNASLNTTQSVTQLTCFGDETNNITIDVFENFTLIDPSYTSPNSFNYTILQSGISVQAQNPPYNVLTGLGGLPAGIYEITVVPEPNTFPNLSSCIDTVSVVITQPDPISLTLQSTDAICFGDSTGTVGVSSIVGGNIGSYNYTWTNNLGAVVGTTSSAANLPAGWYTLSVTDIQNCQPATIDSIQVLQPNDIIISLTVTTIDSCAASGGSTGNNSIGEFHIQANGGSPFQNNEYNFNWWPSGNFSTINSGIISGNLDSVGVLPSGTYSTIITDSAGCSKRDTVTINEGLNPSLDSSSFVNISCNGLSDGSYIAIIDSVNGSQSYPYIYWDFAAGAWTPGYIPSGSGFASGDSITIRLKDNFGCVDNITHVFTEPDSLIIHNVSPSLYTGGANVKCFGDLNGSLSIDSVSGGTSPYYYSINGTPGPVAGGFYNGDSTDHAFDSLAAAWYYTDILDANGCTYRDSIILTQPDEIKIDSFAVSVYNGGWGVSCNGFSDGSSFGYVSGGTYDSVLYNYSYTWYHNTDTVSINDTANNIQANEWYILHVQDVNNCSSFDSIQLTEPTPLQIDSFTINNVLCVGGDRGNATVWVSGATPTYIYSWNNGDTISPSYINPNNIVGSNNDTTALADTLRAGDYIVEIHDANGCNISDTITITEPTISVEIDSLLITQITCYNYNNGSVDIIATGPEPLPYLYTIYDPSNPSIITAQGNLGFNQGLSSGNYVAHVQDGIGCVDRDTFEIFDVDSVYIVSVQWENLSCHGFDDGYVWDIVATGGTWPYEYSIDGSSTRYPSWLCNNQNPSCPTGYVFTGLDPGVHTIEIYDSNNCANSYAFTVTEPSPMQFAVSTNNYNNYQILCDGDLDTAFIVVSGGDPIYTIILDGDSLNYNTTVSTYEWSNINEGWHLFEIFDANNCLIDTNIYFAAPDPISAANSTITEVLCEGACTGVINAVISGGVGQGIGTNYQYQWYEGTSTTGQVIGTSFVLQNLCIDPIDTYSLNVSDDNGCESNFSWSIGSNVLRIDSIATVFNSIEPSCNGYCDGSITIVVNGGDSSQVAGQAPYYYQWDDVLSQTNETAIGLCADTFVCTVTDMAGCVVTKEFILDQPDMLEATIDLIEPVSCNGSSDGELRALASSGTSPYNFTWSQGTILNGQLTSTINGLAPAVYSVFVEDANGCTDTAHYDLTEPQQLDIPFANILISDVKCYADATGSIEVTATGGTLIPGIPGTYEYVLLDENDNVISAVINNPSAVFSGLTVGIYKIEVTDYFGCSYVTGDIYVDQPNEPLSVIIDGMNGTCDNSASLSVYISGGTADYSYEFNNLEGNTNGITSPTGSGNSGSTSVEVPDVGLADYSVLVTDKNGCIVDATTRVRGYENIFLPDNSNAFSEIICQGGLVQIQVEECDGCTYFWTKSQDTIANTSSLEIFSDISWLPIEILTLNITDENGCITSIDVTIEKEDVNAAATPQVNVTPGSSLTLSSASGFSTYIWTNEFGDTVSTEKDYDIFDIQKSSWFWLYVESGSGCKDYDSSYVIVGSQPVDAFSPNGDGYNDFWFVEDIDQFNGNKVQIYNRWGELIFEDSCSPNCWDGKIDGKDAPVGAYYYIIDHNDGTELLKGSITLIR
tara:strand:+ start:58630 stop:65724 length:7095 start_codon:yes stop_codon:yes gene_type:complete